MLVEYAAGLPYHAGLCLLECHILVYVDVDMQ
jgi:hypothetical protein